MRAVVSQQKLVWIPQTAIALIPCSRGPAFQVDIPVE